MFGVTRRHRIFIIHMQQKCWGRTPASYCISLYSVYVYISYGYIFDSLFGLWFMTQRRGHSLHPFARSPCHWAQSPAYSLRRPTPEAAEAPITTYSCWDRHEFASVGRLIKPMLHPPCSVNECCRRVTPNENKMLKTKNEVF